MARGASSFLSLPPWTLHGYISPPTSLTTLRTTRGTSPKQDSHMDRCTLAIGSSTDHVPKTQDPVPHLTLKAMVGEERGRTLPQPPAAMSKTSFTSIKNSMDAVQVLSRILGVGPFPRHTKPKRKNNFICFFSYCNHHM